MGQWLLENIGAILGVMSSLVVILGAIIATARWLKSTIVKDVKILIREEMQEFRQEMKEEFKEFREEMREFRQETREDIKESNRRIEALSQYVLIKSEFRKAE